MAVPFGSEGNREGGHAGPAQAKLLGGWRGCWCHQTAVLVSHVHFFFCVCCILHISFSLLLFFTNSSFSIPHISLRPLIFPWFFFSVTLFSFLFLCLYLLLMQSTVILFHAALVCKNCLKKDISWSFWLSPWLSCPGYHIVQFSSYIAPLSRPWTAAISLALDFLTCFLESTI